MKVFLSSSVYGYEERRRLLMEAIQSVNFKPLLSEKLGFDVYEGKHSHDICLSVIDEADIVVVVLQRRYGQNYYNEKEEEYRYISITHAEYREAVKKRKKIIILAEKEIHEQRHKWKKAPNSPIIDIDEKVFKLFDEITSRKVDNWIHLFSDSFDCRDHLKNRLVGLHNRNITKKSSITLKNRFNIPSKHVPPGTIDVLSYWRIISDSWESVTKVWQISIHNKTTEDFVLNDPLFYPIPYLDAEIIDYDFTLKSGDSKKRVKIDNANIRLELMGNPVQSKAIYFNPASKISLKPDDLLRVELIFKHSEYFQEIDSQCWILTGYLSYLDYPGFRGKKIIQRVYKEYYIAKELTSINGRELAIHTKPDCDWGDNNNRYWILGFGRNFEVNASTKIHFVIK